MSAFKSQDKIKCDLNYNTNKSFLGNSIETNLQAKRFGRNIVKPKYL